MIRKIIGRQPTNLLPRCPSLNLPAQTCRALLPIYLKLAGVAMIWGGTFVAGRLLAGQVSPLLLASLRFLLASLALLLFMMLARVPLVWPSPMQWGRLLWLSGFGIFVYNLCFFHGLDLIGASRAALIVALNPAMIGLASWLLFKERLAPLKVLGIACAVAGAGVVIASGNHAIAVEGESTWRGDLLILGCVLSWSLYSLYSRPLTQALGALPTVAYSIGLGTAMLWLATLIQGEADIAVIAALDTRQWLALGYLGVLGSALAYIWYYQGIAQVGPTQAGVFIALNPLTAVLLGALLLDERLTLGMGAGGLLILAGLYLCNRPVVNR